MKTLEAYAIAKASQGNPLMVFDWNKAAQLIKDRQPAEASAGLSRDWEYTGGVIYRDGTPVLREETYTYLASIWATPELELDGDIVDCFITIDQMPTDWGDDPAGVYWPKSALDILDN